MTTMDVPEVMAMPVVSTGHVAEKDMALCEADSPNNPLIAYSYEYGAWMHIGGDGNDVGGEAALREFGFSHAFVALYLAVKSAGFHYLRLDCDGCRVNGLAFANW